MIKCDANSSGVASLHVLQLGAEEASAFAAAARGKKNKKHRVDNVFFCLLLLFFCEKVIKEYLSYKPGTHYHANGSARPCTAALPAKC